MEIGLVWNNTNDLDLHVLDPHGEHIFFSHRRSASGGELDVDRNAGCGQNLTRQPVEHVVWTERAPLGTYRVGVNHFSNCGAADSTPFRVEISAGGIHKTLQGTISQGDDLKIIDDFVYGGAATPSGSTAAMIMQVLGWTLFGLLVGAGQGGVRKSGEATRNLAIGGALGGTAGGIFFIVSAALLRPLGLGDALSLLCGMVILRCAIGLCMVVAEQALSAALVVANGRYEGRWIALDRPTMRVGRDELFEVYLGGDPSIARHHCTLQRDGGGYFVTAEQAAVDVNGVPITQHPLNSGDRIRIGNTTLVFKTTSSAQAASPSITRAVPPSMTAVPTQRPPQQVTPSRPMPAIPQPRPTVPPPTPSGSSRKPPPPPPPPPPRVR
jgi:hypothetical protein